MIYSGVPILFRGEYNFIFFLISVTTHLHLVPKSRMMELYLHSPIRLNEVVLN
jgi:hypothetical protein